MNTTLLPRRRTATVAATALTLALLATSLTQTSPASAAVTDAPAPASAIPQSQYTLIAADSESAPYPAPPALDGTALAAFDGDPSSQWTVKYHVENGAGVADTPMPHWITFDVGGSFTLTGLNYSSKNQANGPVKDYSVFATDDTAVAHDATADWGAPVATGAFHQPTGNAEVQTVTFDTAVTARYVKFEADSAINGSDNASVSVSELSVLAAGDTTPVPVDPAPPANPATGVTIANGSGLNVEVATNFPQVISYDLSGRHLTGQADALDTFTIDGATHVATTTGQASGATATYTSTFADFPNLTVTSTITATSTNTVVFRMTKLDGSAAKTVDQIAIPNQSLVSVDSSDPHASLARTKISTDSTTTADQFVAITGSTKTDAKPVGTPYGFVSNSQLAAGIITNATDDSKQDNNDNWNTRLQSQIVDAGDGARRAELSVGNYTYAPRGATDPRVATYALPTATVVLSADANGDDAVTWQDAAIAYRTAMTHPLGADRVPDRVVQHIPFNFASEATNPFLKTLDNVKRISMSTDDLGQWVLEKGYANEGHDSGHPDYGDDYNVRAGGLKDLNTLTEVGADYNADFAVHVNATEAYPQAKTFTSRMVQGQPNGWDWLNQSYHIDQRYDLGSGDIVDRFKRLREQAPGIKTVYIDAYYSSGWLADGLAAQLRAMGFEVATEWAYKFEGNSIWSHWANDKNYGGATNKGINSNIIRFIGNSDRDVWNVDPLLGGSDIKEFEGWTGQNDWNRFYDNIWTANLPTKFLQHYQVMNWDFGKSVTLTGGVSAAMVNGKRQIHMGDALVADGGAYLLPWGDPTKGDNPASPSDADKMYYFNADAGSATFDLTDQFAHDRSFTLYKLTDQGRVAVSNVTAENGHVTVEAQQGVPYVLAPQRDKAAHASADYGQGSGLRDPGFNAGSLDGWNPSGGAEIARTEIGDNVATLGEAASALSQTVKGLTAGQQYTLSANVEIGPGEHRPTTLRVNGIGGSTDLDARNTFETTPQQNLVAADAKHGTYSQRASVTFIAPKNHKVTVSIGAVAGSAPVVIDDVRLMASDLDWSPTTASEAKDGATPKGTVIAKDDFEGNQPGWGPFVKGDAGGSTDPRTSISHLHAPYSQKEWKNTYSPYASGSLNGQAVDDVIDGNRSLKAHEENTGLVYRTVPATVPFVAGHKYRVSFDYQTNVDGQWAWITGADTVGNGTVTSTDVTRDTLAPSLTTARYAKDIVAGCGDTWVGLRKLGGANGTDFVLDDFTVTDLGEATGGATCASVTAPASADVSPDVASTFVTTFTNNEKTDATNVALGLTGAPDGWKVQVATDGGNLFGTVKPGESVSTTWVVTPPAAAADSSATLQATGTYYNDCATKTVSAEAVLRVAATPVLSPGSMTATADSENLSSGAAEGPVSNVLDGDPGTIWHTDYTNSQAPYPHSVTLDLHGSATVDGFGYLDRQSGGQNGRVKDYTVSVSDDGTTWRQVASGSLVDSAEMQVVSFSPVTASYVRFTALNALNGLPFAAAAEMRVYGTPTDAPTGFTPAARPADAPCAA